MKISLIIPIYNESKTIDHMLEQLERLPGDWEICFADGGCTDDTLARIGGRYPVLPCPKGRAHQMNAAAGQATGQVLWFVHCDSRLPADAYDQIADAVRQGAQWGCFHIGFDYDGPFMGCNTYFSNRRAKKGIAFGAVGICLPLRADFLPCPLWRTTSSPDRCGPQVFRSGSCRGGSSPPADGIGESSPFGPCGRCSGCGVCTAAARILKRLPANTGIFDKEKAQRYLRFQ